ncbi:MAG TPA: pentapeptide repeat-containing protein [Oscillatoriaceae cyanobacterium M33_DOE_052]|uniref:Pentapeptide repeat-containing protein n=1 Tax=Planktothricoides sp. SpSt-374 TaxID=2282167 RepID=A0A7C3ZKV2_9CYAN|nr:pentapeptide repeat-containing protein [Oscillatoriaceae cyanobacterium M33_DOE_052]
MQAEEIIRKYATGERNFAGVALPEINLSRANLTGINFTDAILSIANLSGCNLSDANLSGAKLNVARLSGANLNKAKLNGAILNVANLVRANMSEAELMQAALIRAELIRADLSRANLKEANLNGADLREAKLRQVNLSGANLSEADMRGTSLAGANLEGATLSGTDLSRSDMSRADLTDADLRHANLSRVNLSGAILRGANLRWADLSGANLRWVDMTEAKLSGANLLGADLSNANLTNASCVHADLTQANLIRVEWMGADMSGATLTGAKLFGVSRYGLKTEGITCEWVDLSQHGDRSEIYKFTSEEAKQFFNQTRPLVRIIIDAPLDQNANFALAGAYHQISQESPVKIPPPSIDVGYRRTTVIFRMDSDTDIFSTAYLACLPFRDAESIQKNIITLMKMLQAHAINSHSKDTLRQIRQLSLVLNDTIQTVNKLKVLMPNGMNPEDISFFQAPTRILLSNSSDRGLQVFTHPNFGQRLMNNAGAMTGITGMAKSSDKLALPSLNLLVEFIQGFYYLES